MHVPENTSASGGYWQSISCFYWVLYR